MTNETKLDIEPKEHLAILEDLKKNNKKEIVIIEIQIEMGGEMFERAKKEDEIAEKKAKKEEDKPKGEKAIAIKMKIDAFEEQRKEMYQGLKFINKKIDEVSKAIKD